MNRNILCSVLLIPFFLSGFSQSTGAIRSFVSKNIFSSSGISISVKNISTGLYVASYNPHLNLTPASTLKVLTTATALEMFGPDYCFETSVAISGKIDSDGVLTGNLYILGNGDPTLGSVFSGKNQNAFFELIFSELKKNGIRVINGSIIGDETRYNTEIIPFKTPWEDMGNYYAAGVSALNYRDNAYKLTFRTGKAGERPQIVDIDPAVAGLSFHNYLIAKSNDKDSAYLYGMPYCHERYLYGTVPAGQAAFIIKGDVPDPALFMVESLGGYLKTKGMKIAKEASTSRLLQQNGGFNKPGLKVICSFKSDPLSHIIQVTNKRSNNFYAESLLRLIASRYSSDASLSVGISAMKQFWKERGLKTSQVLIYDGSGLTPANRVNSALFVEVLQYMTKQSRHRESFFKSLAIAGVDGTLKNFLVNTPLQGKVNAKSGSFEGVLAYCGILDKKGEKIAFCIMVNAFTCPASDVKKAIEQFLNDL